MLLPPGRGSNVYLKVFSMIRALVFLFWVAMLAASGCLNPGDCVINNSGNVQLTLVPPTGTAGVLFTRVAVVGLATPVAANVSGTTLALPVNPDTTQTTYVFTRTNRTDTITFTYRNQVLVLNPDCGAILFHRDLNFSRNTFGAGTLTINNPVLARGVTRNATLRF
jgi:hypothetical protein